MNWNSFGLIGYLSVLLWVSVPLLWLAHRKWSGIRWLCPLALVLAVVSFAFAKINSETHVNRIELDRSDQVAELQAREDAKLKAAEESRGDDVAQIRFAEDASGDFLDKAGMEDADLKYLDSLDKSSEPAWKKEKKTRGDDAGQDDDLEAMLGGKETVEGVDSGVLVEEETKPSAVMSEAGLAMAHRLDGMNLNAVRFMFAVAILMLVVDYLSRANRYAEAYLPLPLPSAWLNGLMPIPPLVARPEPARRSVPEELAWLAKRGDSFIYLTDDAAAASAIPESLPRLGKKRSPVDVIHVSGAEISDDFIFEALWYGRSSFVVDSAKRAEEIIGRFLELMEGRKEVRARVAQTVHVVWDLKTPMPEALESEFTRLAKATGLSLFLLRGK